MIGGYDLVYDRSVSAAEVKDIVIRISKTLWPEAIVEDDEEFDCFIFKNASMRKLWSDLGADKETENTMIYFLARDRHPWITLVVCSTDHPDMVAFLSAVESFRIDQRLVLTKHIGDVIA